MGGELGLVFSSAEIEECAPAERGEVWRLHMPGAAARFGFSAFHWAKK